MARMRTLRQALEFLHFCLGGWFPTKGYSLASYAVPKQIDGEYFGVLDAERMRSVLPALFQTPGAIREADVTTTRGFAFGTQLAMHLCDVMRSVARGFESHT
jgi:hypothetical protein